MKLTIHTLIRRVLASVICGVFAVSTFAVPAYRGWQTKTLPDGSQITVRQVGDEFFHYWETEDGVQYKHDAIKGWHKVEKATMTEEQKAKQASRKYNQQDMSKPRYAAGKINLAPRGLVILVNFSDVSFYSGNTLQAMTDLMNSENYTYDGATGSTREYYRAQSNGQYVPDFDVVGPYTLSNNRAHYGGNGSNGSDLLAGDMVVEACKAADADGVDFTKYNNDGDSYIDFVYIIYAGAGEADSDVDEAIWPHNWDLASARYYNNCTYTSSQSKVDGLYINNYACSGELNYGVAGSRCGIGTVAHEFGHVLGLPDYYVTDKEATSYAKRYTPGAWTIMDYGSYNNDGKTPPNYSVFDKYYFGWDTPELLAKDAQRDITLTTAYSDSYQITGGTSLLSARTTQRVWYIENRQKTGWDAYLPGHGMIVWEVTFSSSNWTSNVPNNNTVGYTIVTANNTARPYTPYVTKTSLTSTSGTPFPGTSKVKSYTPATGCAMTEITESDGVITFKYNGGDVDYWTYGIEGTHCVVPANGSVDKGAALNLTITPEEGYTLADADCWIVEMGSDILEYGVGFTYNENNGAFAIPSVTGNVYIVAKAKAVPVQITWMANGSEFTKTNAEGSVVLPTSEPAACEGKVFVGWCADPSYESESTAPTFVKNGDAISATTFYAVYATEGESVGSSNTTYTFNSKSWGDATSSWTSDKDGVQLMSGQGVQVTTGASGAGATTKSSVVNVSKVVVSFCTNKSSGAGSIDITVGSTTVSKSVNSSGGTSLRDLEFDFSNASGKVSVVVNCTENSIYVNSITITTSGGATYSDFTTSCTVPTEVTVTFDANGGTGEMSAQVIPYNEATALNACTFTRTGYSFAGWATSATGEKAYDDEAKVTLTKNTTLYAIWTINQYNVTFEPSITGATVTINGQSTSPQSVTYGTTVTINTIINADYRLVSIAAVAANEQAVDLSGTGTSRTFTMPASAVTVTVVVGLIPTHTVTWSANGDESNKVTYKEGAAIVFPETATGCDGKVFRGWSATTVDETDEEPTYVKEATMGTNNITYYAVFATQDGEGSQYKLVSSLTSGKEYIFVTRNTAGNGYAFSSAITTGTNVTIVESGSDKIVSGTPVNSIIWTVTSGFTLTTNDETKTNKKLKINGTTFGLDATGSSNLAWTTDFGLNGRSNGSTKYYLQCSNGTFEKNTTSSTTNRVWAYEKTGAISYSAFSTNCTPCTSAVTINKGTASNGSFYIDKVGEQSTCGEALVVTVSDIVPAHGYKFKEITQSGIEGAVIDQEAKTVTYAKKANGASTINVVFVEKSQYTIAFYDNGTQIGETQEVYEGEKFEIPTNPSPACSAYTFVGWWTEELAANNTVAQTWIIDFTDVTATQNQNYYAIYKKTVETESTPVNNTYTFTSKSWADETKSWTSDKDGGQLIADRGVQVTTTYSEAGATTKSSFENVSKVVVNYCTNANDGNGSIKITIGEAEETKNVTKSGGTSLRNLEYDFDKVYGKVSFEVTCSKNSIYVNAITITSGGSSTTTYYSSTVSCGGGTSVENTSAEQVAVKALMNGQIVIIRGDAIYSITGVRIQ